MASVRSTKNAIFRGILEVKRPNRSHSSNGTIKKTRSNISLKNDKYDKTKSKVQNRSVLSLRKSESKIDKKEKERNIKHTPSDSIKYEHEKKASASFKRQFSLPSTKQEKSRKYKEQPNASVIKKDEMQEEPSYKFYVDENIEVDVNLVIADNKVNSSVNEPRVINVVRTDVDRPPFMKHLSNESNNNVTNLIDFDDTSDTKNNDEITHDSIYDNWFDQNQINSDEYTEVVQTFNYQHQYLKYLRKFLKDIDETMNEASTFLDQNIGRERVEDLLEKFHNLSEICFKEEITELNTALNNDGDILEICEIQVNKIDENEYDNNDINVINSALIIRQNDNISEDEGFKENSFSEFECTPSNRSSVFIETMNDKMLSSYESTSKRASFISYVNSEDTSSPVDQELSTATILVDSEPEILSSPVNSSSEIISSWVEPNSAENLIDEVKFNNLNINRQMQFIIDELNQTEIKYVSDLDKVVNKFKPFMYKEANNHRDKMRYVFSNIDKIYTGAQIFQNELKDLLDALEIADLFIKHEKYFAMYENYVRNKPKYDYNLKYFDKEMKALMVKFNEKLNLASYLMVPFQRLGKYILMLEKMDEELSKQNEESTSIKEAIGIIRNVLANGNTSVAIDSINGCPLKGSHWGAFIMRDEFTCIKPKRMDIVLFLFEHVVVLTTAQSKQKERFDHIEYIMLTDLTFNSSDGNLIELGNYGKRKKVVDRKMSYKLEAKTDKNFQRWTSEIEDRLWSQMNLVKAENAMKTLKKRTEKNYLPNNTQSNNYDYVLYSSGITEGRTTFYSPSPKVQ